VESQTLDAVPEAAKEIPVEKASRAVGLSSGVIFVISLVIQLIGYFATYFFAQGIGLQHGSGGADPSGRVLLGILQFYLFLASSINGIGDLRIGAAYTFFVARGKSPDESTGTYLVLRFLMVGSAGLLLLLFSQNLQGTSGPLAIGSTELATLGIFLALPILWSVSTVYTQLKIAKGESICSQYPLLLESIVRTSCLVFVATHNPTIWTITLAYVPGAVVSTLYCLPAVRQHFHGFLRSEASGLFRFAWPLMGGLVLTYLAGNAMGILVFSQAGAQSLYFFNAANGFRILALAVPMAVIVPLFPSLTSLHARGMLNPIRTQTWHALRFTAMAVVPGAVYLVVYRVPVLHILYNYQVALNGNVALAFLAASSIPFALTLVIGTALQSIRLQRLELYLTSVQVTVMFGVAMLLMIPFFPPLTSAVDSFSFAGIDGLGGINGASVAILASSITALAVNTYFLERHLQLRVPYRPILTITFAAAVGFFAVSRFNILVVGISRWYQLFPGIVIGFTVYALVLAAIGELSRSDVLQLGGMAKVPDRVLRPLSRLCWRRENPYAPESTPKPAGTEVPLEGAGSTAAEDLKKRPGP
jgi:O-antigen/teichoic acid export membrane protein